jgi:hypothetical protein
VFGGLYRRQVFEKIGLFDAELVRNQDDEFNLRLTRAGLRIWQSPRIKSWYSPRGSLRALFHQYFQYGYWKVRVIQKHRLPASVRHLVPATFVLALTMLPVAALVWPVAAYVWLALVIAYAAGLAGASALAAKQWGVEVLVLMPLVFICCHVGYGTGFITGVRDLLLGRRVSRLTHQITRQT